MNRQSTPPLAPHEALKSEIARFCEANSMTKTALGISALGDPGFVAGLEAGREPRWSTVQRVRDWMAQQEAGAA
jgi:hypothetical protein